MCPASSDLPVHLAWVVFTVALLTPTAWSLRRVLRSKPWFVENVEGGEGPILWFFACALCWFLCALFGSVAFYNLIRAAGL